MSDDRKDLPPVNAPNFLEKVREALSVYLGNRGDKLDRGLTVRDLANAGLVEVSARYLAGGGGRVPPISGAGPAVAASEPDLTPPPTPTGFAAAAAISNLLLECDAPTYTQGNGHAKSVLYGATWTSGPLPVFAGAVRLTEFSGNVASYATNPASTWHLWLTWVTVDGVESEVPAGGTNGVAVTTGQDVTSMVDAMTGAGKPFTVLIAPTSIGGVTFPAGIYATNAFLQDLQVTNAKIAALAVDDAKVANLSAAKLTAGSIAVGEYIQGTGYVAGSDGWRINGDGTAEFSNAVVRGTVYANAGVIGGITISDSAVRAGQTAYNTGQGFFLGSNGTFSLGNSGGNRLTWDGANLNVVGGGTFSGALSAASGTFAGALIAATGSFSGSLSAATGTFSGNLSAAGGTFAGALSAASGTFSGTLTASAINAVNTINIAGNAVTVSNSTSGASPSVSVYVPAGQTASVSSTAFRERLFYGGSVPPMQLMEMTHALTGTAVSNANGGWSGADGGESSVYYANSMVTVKNVTVTGPATVTATASANGYTVALSIFGAFK